MARIEEIFLECVKEIIDRDKVDPIEVEAGLKLIEYYTKFLKYSSLKTKIKADDELLDYIKKEFETKPLIISLGGFGLIGKWIIPIIGYPVLLSWTKNKNELISVYCPEINILKKRYFHKFKTTPHLTALLSNEL